MARLLLYGASSSCSRHLHGGRTCLLASLTRQSVCLGPKPFLLSSLHSRHSRLVGAKCLYSTSQEDGEGEGGEEAGEGSEGSEDAEKDKFSVTEVVESEDGESLELLPPSRHHALATIVVPDHFPDVPLLPISRSPIFPRLARMLEAGALRACMLYTCNVAC